MMRVSLNEIETTLRRASVGAGLPVGIAEEISTAARWLSERGLDGAAAGLAALQNTRPAQLPLAIGPQAGNLTLSGGSAALAGPSALDYLLADSRLKIHLPALDSPLLLAGLAGAASFHAGGFMLSFEKDIEVLITPAGLSPLGAMPTGPADMSLYRFEHVSPAQPVYSTGTNVDMHCWKALQNLAARTYVPETTESRKRGAGAGLNDND